MFAARYCCAGRYSTLATKAEIADIKFATTAITLQVAHHTIPMALQELTAIAGHLEQTLNKYKGRKQ